MTINIRNININYIQYGSGSDVVLLHGWGQNIAMMKPIGDRLQKNHRITILDFPGFGESEEPKTALTVYDYCEILEELLKKLKVKKPVIMGHSFGGRIAIIYASRNEVEKVVLFGSPCIRKEVKPSLKLRMLKSLKKIPGINKLEGFAKNHMGSRDYKNACEVMKKILVNVVNEDLSECAKKINVPTLLIWGDRDTEAPVEDAKELEKIIPDAGLIVLPNSTHYALPGTHYAYLENLGQVINILNNFL